MEKTSGIVTGGLFCPSTGSHCLRINLGQKIVHDSYRSRDSGDFENLTGNYFRVLGRSNLLLSFRGARSY